MFQLIILTTSSLDISSALKNALLSCECCSCCWSLCSLDAAGDSWSVPVAGAVILTSLLGALPLVTDGQPILGDNFTLGLDASPETSLPIRFDPTIAVHPNKFRRLNGGRASLHLEPDSEDEVDPIVFGMPHSRPASSGCGGVTVASQGMGVGAGAALRDDDESSSSSMMGNINDHDLDFNDWVIPSDD